MEEKYEISRFEKQLAPGYGATIFEVRDLHARGCPIVGYACIPHGDGSPEQQREYDRTFDDVCREFRRDFETRQERRA